MQSRRQSNNYLISRSLILCTVILLNGCAALVGAVAVTAIDISVDRRPAGRYVDDNMLETKLRFNIKRLNNLRSNSNISVTAFNGVVLLTGQMADDSYHGQIIELVESQPQVVTVIDEIVLGAAPNRQNRVRDSWITSKIKSRLYAQARTAANKVKVVTENGVVYMLGLVTRAEADKVVEKASQIKGIRRIVKAFEYID